jgi:tRNA pseudouridine synthase 10
MAATNAPAEEEEARSILARAVESTFPPLHAVHHLLSVGVRLLCLCGVYLLSVAYLISHHIQLVSARTR